ncbi:MAG: cytochrome b N-terminal domain-containing protein [Tepidamorphaceae bacterium]
MPSSSGCGAASLSVTPTLNRFFSLHYLLPFVIVGLVVPHAVWALHVPGNNPTGVEVKSAKDTVPFHPYYTVKDLFAIIVFLIFFSVSCSTRRTIWATRQLHAGQPAGDAFAHRSGMVISCRSTRSCARSPTSSACAGDVCFHRRAVHPAVA